MDRIALLCPPDRGGVGAHTERVRRSWLAKGSHVAVLDPREAGSGPQWPEGTGALLIQYVPFLYGRRGLSRIPEAYASAARRTGIRVTTFVHEPYVPATRPAWWVLSPLQRWQLSRVLARSDAVVTAVPGWVPRLRPDAEIVYVGSVLDVGAPPVTEGSRLVVFSPLASGLRWDWIGAAIEALDEPPLIVGATAEQLRTYPPTRALVDDTWDCRGFLSSTELGAVLAQAKIALQPFVDGASGRRTSLLTVLSLGIRVISSGGPLYDPVFDRGLIAPVTREAFVDSVRSAWQSPEGDRAGRLAWFRAHFDPAQLDARLHDIATGHGS